MKVLNKNTKTSKKKTAIVTLAIIAAIILALGLFAYSTKSWPFTTQESTNNTNTPVDEPNNPDGGNNNGGTEEPAGGDSTNTDDSDTDYVNPGISNPPTDNSPYPIETERYRIDQRSTTSFSVELYPIVNNPQYSNYEAQLRAYKNEVLTYLRNRYGDIDNFTISWLPEDARNL